MVIRFVDAFDRIMRIAPKELANEMKHNVGYWHYDKEWQNLQKCVRNHIVLSKDDPISIEIYALAYRISKERLMEHMKKHN